MQIIFLFFLKNIYLLISGLNFLEIFDACFTLQDFLKTTYDFFVVNQKEFQN